MSRTRKTPAAAATTPALLETGAMPAPAAPARKRGLAKTLAVSPQAATTPASAPAAPPRQTKAALLCTLLAAPGGASLATLVAATGWQSHSVRAALTGIRKFGTEVQRRNEDGTTFYAITAEAAAQ